MKGDCNEPQFLYVVGLKFQKLDGGKHERIKNSFNPTMRLTSAWSRARVSASTTKAIAEEYGRSMGVIMHWAREGIISSLRLGWRTRLYDPEQGRAALVHVWMREAERLLRLWWLTGDLRSLVVAVIHLIGMRRRVFGGASIKSIGAYSRILIRLLRECGTGCDR